PFREQSLDARFQFAALLRAWRRGDLCPRPRGACNARPLALEFDDSGRVHAVLDSFQPAALQQYLRGSCLSISGRGEAGKIISEDFDVLFREQLCRRGHVPVEIGSGLVLEAPQLRSQIGELLAREPRNVLQAEKCGTMALHAMVLLGKASSGGGVFRSRLMRSGRRFLPGK